MWLNTLPFSKKYQTLQSTNMPITNTKLLIFGFGGHARSVTDVALSCGYQTLVFFDATARPDENFLGHPVVESLESFDFSGYEGFPASGDNLQRHSQFNKLQELGIPVATLISPTATVGPDSNIATGCFIGNHAHVGPMSQVGIGSIINTGAILEHESSVGCFSHVAVNATIAGRSHLGDFSFLGAGAVVLDKVSVGSRTVIGAGGIVNRPLDQPGTYVGVPVRKIDLFANKIS